MPCIYERYRALHNIRLFWPVSSETGSQFYRTGWPIWANSAFEELRKVLEKSDKFRFLFNEPTFIKKIIANDKEVKEFELQMHQRERNVSEFNLEIDLNK